MTVSSREDRSGLTSRALRLVRVAVGLVLWVAAGAKALAPEVLARQITAYGWWPVSWSPTTAVLLIAAELILGTALVLEYRPRIAAGATLVLLLVFAGATTEAWANDRIDACGCFGRLAERGPGSVVLFDLLMCALLLPSLPGRYVGSGGREAPTWRRSTVLAAGCLGLVVPLLAPRLPLDDLLTELVVGADLRALDLEDRAPDRGPVLLAFLDLRAERSRGAVAGLNAIAVGLPAAGVVGFAVAAPDDRATFSWTAGAGFAIEEIGLATLNRLVRRTPRFALLVDGRVIATWEGAPPDVQTVRSVLADSV